MNLDACLACGGDGLKEVADLGESPVLTGALFDDKESARRAARGPLQLSVCQDCSHVQNVAFDPALVQYDVSYDNSLHFSGTFQRYADELAGRLIDEYDIRGKYVVEIGSGKGDFLRALCELGHNVGVGYDPTVEPDTHIPNVRLVRDYFRPGDDVEKYDLLICRHVLEHLGDPASLLRALASVAPPSAVHYFEVPAAEFNFSPDGLWDCIYPHVSYFSRESLASLIHRSGFQVISIRRSFHGQFLGVHARAGIGAPPGDGSISTHLELVQRFVELRTEAVSSWRVKVARALSNGETIAAWGAGSKGVNFLTATDPAAEMIAVDISPRKWGKFLVGTGHEIFAPSGLAKINISAVAVMNPAYYDEIVGLLDQLRINAEVMTI